MCEPRCKKDLGCWMFRGLCFGVLGVQGLRAVGLRGVRIHGVGFNAYHRFWGS